MQPLKSILPPYMNVSPAAKPFLEQAELIEIFTGYIVTTDGEFTNAGTHLGIIGRHPKPVKGRGRPSTKGRTIKATYALPPPTHDYLDAISAFINRPNNDVIEIAVALLFNKLNRPSNAKKAKKS